MIDDGSQPPPNTSVIRAGDIVSDSPELSNPASFAGSIGNVLVGTNVDAGQITDAVIVFGVAQSANRHGSGITGVSLGLELTQAANPLDQRTAIFVTRFVVGICRRHLTSFDPLQDRQP